MMELKLGKGPVKFDKLGRTIQYAKVRLPLTVLAPPPASFDAQAAEGVTDNNVFLNTTYGDCVLASAYHALMVFEKLESGQVVVPTDDEVKTTYFTLTGGVDSGLVYLDFLNYWRQTGIPAQGKIYKIHAFTSIDWKNHAEVEDAIYYLKNVLVGINLPSDAGVQYNAGQPWTLTTGPGAAPGSWGDHGVYDPAYIPVATINEIGPVFETWGKRQQATWEWWDAYCDECYGIVMAQNIPNSPIDPVALDQILSEITAEPVPPEPDPIPTPTPPAIDWWQTIINWIMSIFR